MQNISKCAFDCHFWIIGWIQKKEKLNSKWDKWPLKVLSGFQRSHQVSEIVDDANDDHSTQTWTEKLAEVAILNVSTARPADGRGWGVSLLMVCLLAVALIVFAPVFLSQNGGGRSLQNWTQSI